MGLDRDYRYFIKPDSDIIGSSSEDVFLEDFVPQNFVYCELICRFYMEYPAGKSTVSINMVWFQSLF